MLELCFFASFPASMPMILAPIVLWYYSSEYQCITRRFYCYINKGMHPCKLMLATKCTFLHLQICYLVRLEFVIIYAVCVHSWMVACQFCRPNYLIALPCLVYTNSIMYQPCPQAHSQLVSVACWTLKGWEWAWGWGCYVSHISISIAKTAL